MLLKSSPKKIIKKYKKRLYLFKKKLVSALEISNLKETEQNF